MDYCGNNCTVTAFEDLFLCREPTCFQPPLRCKNCFKFIHKSKGEDNKPIIHEYEKFNETIQCKNLVRLIKIEEYISDKIKGAMGEFKTNIPGLSSTAFFQSQLIFDTFPDMSTRNQFAFFREVFYHRQVCFPMPPSAQFVTGLTVFNEKKFNEAKKILIQGSPEEQMMNYSFNLISGSDSSELENFIMGEQSFFSQYCSKLEKEEKQFQINQYLRESNQREGKNPIYYKGDFTNFLEDKYGKNPGGQQIFTIAQYSKYIWKKFSFYEYDEEVSGYLQGEIELYRTYSKFVQEEKVKERLLGFRMWKTHAAPISYNVKNKYFMDSFISAYIQYLIDEKTWSIGKPKAQTWKDYAQYLKDYVFVVQKTQQQFVDFIAYQKYFDFRKEKEKFFDYLKNSENISFNRAYAIEYVNKVFVEDGKVSNKSYKAFVEEKDLKEQEQMMQLRKKIENLRKELEEKEGQYFYITVFENFAATATEMDFPINIDSYFMFKNQILEDVNEDYIRQQNERILLEKKRADEGPQEELLKSKTVKLQVTEVQQRMHIIIDHEQEESQGEAMEICMCCGGEPDDCQQAECQMMGYCVNCCL